MSDYTGIQGQAVINTGSDPSPGINGQVWYNNATYAFKISNEVAAGAWATGGNLATARRSFAGAGTQTSGLGFGGYASPTPVVQVQTEEYDGSTWTAGGNMGSGAYQSAGCGTQTAGLSFGGQSSTSPLTPRKTEEYDGTSWTAGGNLPLGRFNFAGGEIQTAALSFGGSGSAQ